jgi:hypothetical protein
MPTVRGRRAVFFFVLPPGVAETLLTKRKPFRSRRNVEAELSRRL